MGTAHAITLKNTTIHGINNAMDRKNINSGFKKRRAWQDAVSLFTPAISVASRPGKYPRMITNDWTHCMIRLKPRDLN
jgi:hypothetical protein